MTLMNVVFWLHVRGFVVQADGLGPEVGGWQPLTSFNDV